MSELNSNSRRENNLIADLEGRISIVVNTLLFALKYWAGAVQYSA